MADENKQKNTIPADNSVGDEVADPTAAADTAATPEMPPSDTSAQAREAAPDTEKAAGTASSLTIWHVVAGVIALAVALYLAFSFGLFGTGASTGSETANRADMANTVAPAEGPVARVNGAEISAAAYNQRVEQINAQAAAAGGDAASAQVQEQALDSLIATELLAQAAASAGINVSDADVDAEYENIASQFSSTEELQTRMQEMGVSEDQLRNELATEIQINQYMESELANQNFSVTEEEIAARYEQMVAGADDAPELDTVSAQIEQQLLAEKQQGAVQSIIDKLRAEASVEILL